jgi:mannosyltransferase
MIKFMKNRKELLSVYRMGVFFSFVVFFGLRLYRIGFYNFWYDEVFTIYYSGHPWNNINAPLYGILLHFWRKLFGISELSLRFPSLIFSFLSVILTYFLGKKLFGRKTGLLAAMIMGISPFQLWYAQEARDYSMLLFMGTASTYLLIQALDKQTIKHWFGYIVVSAGALYTSYFFSLLFAAHFVYIFFSKQKRRFKRLIPFLIVIFSFSFYYARFNNKFQDVFRGFWIPQPNFQSLLITIENFLLGYNGNVFSYATASILAVVGLLPALMKLKNKELKPPVLFCACLFLAPIVFAFIFSRLVFSIYIDRGFITLTPYFYLLLSWGVINFKYRKQQIVYLTILVFLMLASVGGYHQHYMPTSSLHHTGVHPKKPIKPLVEFLEQNTTSNDKIFYTHEGIGLPFNYYAKRNDKQYFLMIPGKAVSPYSLEPVSHGVPVEHLSHFDFTYLWVMFGDWPRDGSLDDNSMAVKKFLDEHFELKLNREFDGIWLRKYKKIRKDKKVLSG